MRLFKLYFVFATFIFLSIVACKKNKPKPFPELASLNLLRGELILCSSEQFGDVNFSLACNYETRETFDLAISLLHSFEYAEAEKAFVKVIDADPNCAMAYWGVAMSNLHSLWAPPTRKELEKGAKILEIAKKIPKSERETDYLNALTLFYKGSNKISHKKRLALFSDKMEKVYKKYTDDKEAAIFYALALRATADPKDKTYAKQLRSGEILESIFPDQPNHPGIAHYIIHNYDYPELAEKALPTARRYAKIAPASSHAQHMPSHIFTRLGLWQESIDTNINAVASALCYAESVNPDAHWDEEVHGMEYLVYAYLQIGDNQKAKEQYDYLKTFKKIFPVNFKVAYTAASIPSRIALENKNWKAATKLELPLVDILPWKKFPWEKSILHFAKSLGASHLGDTALAEKELLILEGLHQELIDLGDSYKANQVQTQIYSAKAWLQFAKNNYKEALVLIKEAVELEEKTAKHPVTPGELVPARELLGDLYLAMNKPLEALDNYEKDMKIHPNRFNGLYGAAIAAQKINNKEKAQKYFKALLSLTKGVDSNRPEIKEAEKYLRSI